MRGFLAAGLLLVALDVVLQSPASRVAQALVLPSRWLAAWMSADTPLISRAVPSSSAPSTNPANTPAAINGSNKATGAPPGTPPNPGIPPLPTAGPGTGVIYPPGSQTIN